MRIWIVAIALTCAACASGPPGHSGRRVLFDEAHHNVHTASGRYRPFVELIAAEGYAVSPNAAPFSTEVLRGSDLLVIASARGAGLEAPLAKRGNPAFTAAEADAVRDWVRAGGALLLITDHYPIGGANQILADRFGVAMSNGWTEDPEHHRDGPQEIVFSRRDGLLGDHPITEDIERVVTFGGQSLQGPPESFALLRLSASAVERFPDGRKVSAAGRSQGIVMSFGRGRILILGEAAMLTSQEDAGTIGFTVPGFDNRQFALNVMRWLRPTVASGPGTSPAADRSSRGRSSPPVPGSP
jgi:hypothetical protein